MRSRKQTRWTRSASSSTRWAGLRAAKKIAAVAEASGIQFNIGGLAVLSQLEAAAGAHFYASSPERHVMPAAEFIFGLGVAGPDPLVPDTDFVIKDGHVTPPSRPGSRHPRGRARGGALHAQARSREEISEV